MRIGLARRGRSGGQGTAATGARKGLRNTAEKPRSRSGGSGPSDYRSGPTLESNVADPARRWVWVPRSACSLGNSKSGLNRSIG
jgi:hypothetical protein